jgi:hypothetical protein
LVLAINSKIDVVKDSNMLNNKAATNPSTLNPLTKRSVNKIIDALIINKNNPSEKIVRGIVKNTSKGLTTAFKKAKTAATIM